MTFGSIAPFVDTTDAWMVPKGARIVVPFATVLLISTILAEGLATLVGAPLVLGLAIRGIVMAGAVADRAHKIALSFRR